MNTAIERRRYPRIPLKWPLVLMTRQGPIKGETGNISVGGLAMFMFKEMPNLDYEFQIILKLPANLEMKVTCEKMWADKIIDEESVHYGVGVRFVKISPGDLEIINTLVTQYYDYIISVAKSRDIVASLEPLDDH